MQTKRALTTDYTDCTDKEKSQKMRSSIISKSAKSVVEMIRVIFRLRISGLKKGALASRSLCACGAGVGAVMPRRPT
jgi:hypothetical protein